MSDLSQRNAVARALLDEASTCAFLRLEKDVAYPAEGAWFRVYEPTGSYRVWTSGPEARLVQPGLQAEVEETLDFAWESEAAFLYWPLAIVSWIWFGKDRGPVAFTGRTVSLASPTVGKLLVRYRARFDRWTLGRLRYETLVTAMSGAARDSLNLTPVEIGEEPTPEPFPLPGDKPVIPIDPPASPAPGVGGGGDLPPDPGDDPAPAPEPTPVPGGRPIRGEDSFVRVVSECSGDPIPGAFVRVSGGRSAVTDAAGLANVGPLAPGPHSVLATKDGYIAMSGEFEVGNA